MKHILTAALIALAAPATAAPSYVAEAATLLRRNMLDVSSARNVQRTAPFEGRIPFVGRVVQVCFRMNAANAFGGLTGTQTHTIVFYSPTKVVLFGNDDHNCDRGGWRPYPEFVR